MSLFRRRDKPRDILRYIQEHGPSDMSEVSKGTRIFAPNAAYYLAVLYADGHLRHVIDPDPDEYGNRHHRYDITYDGQLHLERDE